MTNKAQIKKQKMFRMLIGDDSFTETRDVECSLLLILDGMKSVTGIDFLKGNIKNSIYRCREFPIRGFNGAEIRVANSVQEMIRYGGEKYNWIATDLNYGQGYETGGIEVLEALKDNHAIKAVFTSEDDPRILEKLTIYGADYIVSPRIQHLSLGKTRLLGRVIGEHYQIRHGGEIK